MSVVKSVKRIIATIGFFAFLAGLTWLECDQHPPQKSIDEEFAQKLLALTQGDFVENVKTHEVLLVNAATPRMHAVIVFRRPGAGPMSYSVDDLAVLPREFRIVHKGDADWADAASRWILGSYK